MNKLKSVLIILVLALLITGCSAKGSTKATTSNGKGRYMEENISLPEGISTDATLQLKKIDGMPCLYVYSTTDDDCLITRYLMNGDGTWIEDTPTWLSTVQLTPGCLWLNNVFEDGMGNQYLYSLELDGEQVKGMLLRSSDGSTYEKITPEGWDIKNEEFDFYEYPQLVNALSDGTLIALNYGGDITYYNKDTFKKENIITGTSYVETILSIHDQSIIVGQINMDNYNLLGIDVYNANSAQKIESYPFSTIQNSSNYLDVNDTGDLLLCNADGIHILEQGSSLWQTIADGTLNSLSRGTMWSTGFIAGSDLNYYVLYSSDQGFKLIKYYFNEKVDTIPSTELTVYALKDSSTLRQAASLFQESHPNVKVSFLIVMSDEEFATATDATKEDYIKSLNTELLTGKGSDIIVLDELPVDSLIEKGILSDLSDVINPLLDNGELYENIIQHYFHNEKIYNVPVRYKLPLLLSREVDASSISSLESLAAYIKELPNKNLFGRSTYADFISTYSPFLSTRILNNDGSINRENLITVLNQLKDISAGYELTDNYSGDYYGASNAMDMASKVELSSVICSSFLDSMYPLGIVTYVQGNFTPFDQSAIPSCEIGINSNSDQQELCKEFVALVLSKEVVINDFYDGFSINKEALLLSAASDRSSYTASSEIENADGSFSEITFEAIAEEQIQNLVQACNNANKIAFTDDQIISAIKEEAKDLLTNNKSVEETADQIIDSTKIYLSE
ncbi:MAG TPA: hypothetical protein VJZ06_03195 [Mobilitalea sp.]|nr:hypothetical protein [Mobilitalea sp.]